MGRIVKAAAVHAAQIPIVAANIAASWAVGTRNAWTWIASEEGKYEDNIFNVNDYSDGWMREQQEQ